MRIPSIIALLFLLGAAIQAATITVPSVEVNTLTHSFEPGFFPFEPSIVRDHFAIGDGGYSGGGSFSVSGISNGDLVIIRLQAVAGMKFVIEDPNATLAFDFLWQAGGDTITMSGGTVTFENLVGSTPADTYMFLGVGNAGNAIKAEMQFGSAGLIEFTAIDITIPVQSSPGAGPHDFGALLSNSSSAFGAYAFSSDDHTVMSLQAIPEPSAALLGVAGASLAALRRKRRLA